MLFPDKETEFLKTRNKLSLPQKAGTSETRSRGEGRMSRIRPQTSVVPEVQGLAL